MARKELIFDFILTAIVRGILSIMIVSIGILADYSGEVPIPVGLIFAIVIMIMYLCSFIDEAILMFKECKKVRL